MKHEEIYRTRAEKYDHLVSFEDYEGNLLKEIRRLCDPAGLDIAELGAGTGRITAQLVPSAGTVSAFDISEHMLNFASEKLEKLGNHNWTLKTADNRSIPLPDSSADLALSGWSIGYFSSNNEPDWIASTGKSVAEMERIVRPGGAVIIIETLGTGHETPVEPMPELTRYYALLEKEHGFTRSWIRTDYRFRDLKDAEETVRFFFGDTLGDYMKERKEPVLPECTGFWFKRKLNSSA